VRVTGSAIAALLTASVSLGMLTACVTEHICVSWVDFETPQEAYDDARLVVAATAEPTGATRNVLGVSMPVYAIEVTETLKGEAPDDLTVTPAPLTCMGGASEFPDGVDPLATDEELIVFLHLDERVWRLITPTDGALPMPADGVLPFEVAAR
jgi:hypothetical protein